MASALGMQVRMGMVLAVGVVALYRDQVEPAMAHATFGA